jgi:FtsP/CotA-like multicopper oxidase with cupredoxin domain
MLSRRELLKLSGLAAMSSSLPMFARGAATARDLGVAHDASRTAALAAAPDYRLEIAPVTLELSPRHTVRTIAYNGQAPGPLLRFKEGQPVTIDVANHSDRPEIVHWHGLFLPPDVDGATEEGTPPIAASQTTRYVFTPRPSGFRWYHTHTMAMGDLTLGQYGGQHGLLMIEPRNDPARYDQEFFLVLHDWDGRLLASDDGAMNPSYAVSTINGKVMGAGEPLRVKQGQRVLLHVLNSSPTEVHWVSFAGHGLQVVALDGNPVPTPHSVPMLRLAPAERVCALVEMNNPGVWISARCASTCKQPVWPSSWSTPTTAVPRNGSSRPISYGTTSSSPPRKPPPQRSHMPARSRQSTSHLSWNRSSAVTAPWKRG